MAMMNTPEATPGKVRRARTSTRIDMTPMVDLAFLLLTFFMLATRFLDPRTVEIVVPEKANQPATQPSLAPDKALTLVLGGQNKIYFYTGLLPQAMEVTYYTKEGVRKLLQQKSAVEGLYVFIKPTPQSRYQNLIDIFDELDDAKIKKYALVKVTAEEMDLVRRVGQ